MASGKNKNYVSFWFWLFAIFVMAIPCVGIIMTVVWAFWGENESQKNYFRAMIAWILIFLTIWLIMMAVGISPILLKKINLWLNPTPIQ